ISRAPVLQTIAPPRAALRLFASLPGFSVRFLPRFAMNSRGGPVHAHSAAKQMQPSPIEQHASPSHRKTTTASLKCPPSESISHPQDRKTSRNSKPSEDLQRQ